MFKKIILLFLIILLALPVASAEETVQILALNFPAYDIARSVSGNSAQISMLLPPGSESHSYEPTPQDIIAIQNADLFIYTGVESDHWIEEILHSLEENAPDTFRLSDPVVMLAEETSASMAHTHAHEHDEHCEDHEHAHSDLHAEMDEHVWTSPKNVKLIASALCEKMCALFPSYAANYINNLQQYLDELSILDAAFEDIVKSAERKLIVFGDRFPFRYFASAYGLEYDAAFPGCSEDSEPSVRTVISLIDTVREKQIPVVFYIEFSSRRTVDILAEETNAVPMLFHSCHNVSFEEIQNGATYLSLMWQNAEVLKEALN